MISTVGATVLTAKRLLVFFGGLGPSGTGTVVFRYGGEQYKVIVENMILGTGWHRFVARVQLTTGIRLLLAHSIDRVIYVVLFENGVGLNLLSDSSSLGQMPTGLMEPATVPGFAEWEIRRTAYFPKYMAQFFSRPSRVVMFRRQNC
ncbi:hypothetical protein LIER_26708 [Lithospermum erythrorhizon]|uniref:Uncharacterized protein n=1 Tax=Lithospermum erythrorhizon TaxID=34254 RepID=A0AAV3RDJ9_LITER